MHDLQHHSLFYEEINFNDDKFNKIKQPKLLTKDAIISGK